MLRTKFYIIDQFNMILSNYPILLFWYRVRVHGMFFRPSNARSLKFVTQVVVPLRQQNGSFCSPFEEMFSHIKDEKTD